MGRKNKRGGHIQIQPRKSIVTLEDRFDEKTGEYKKLKYEPIPLQSKPYKRRHGRRKSSPHD